MGRTTARLFFATLLAGLACGCGDPAEPYRDVVPRPLSRMGGDLRSGLTLEETKALASFRDCAWQVREGERVTPDPPFIERYTTKAASPACRHLGVPGSIELEFANDRLMSVDFVPDDVAAYLRAVEQEIVERVQVGTDSFHQSIYHLEDDVVMSVFESNGRTVVGWRDARLGNWLLSGP